MLLWRLPLTHDREHSKQLGVATWKKIIKTGKAGCEAKWQKVGRQTTLTSQEEAALAKHIKARALAGYLATNNAVVIWGSRERLAKPSLHSWQIRLHCTHCELRLSRTGG